MAAERFSKMSADEKVAFIERAILWRNIPGRPNFELEFYRNQDHSIRIYSIALIIYNSCVNEGGCDAKEFNPRDLNRLPDLFDNSMRDAQFFENMLQRFSDAFHVYPYIFEGIPNFQSLMECVMHIINIICDINRILPRDKRLVFAAYIGEGRFVLRTMRDGKRFYQAEGVDSKYLRCYLAFHCLGLSQEMCRRILKDINDVYFNLPDYSNIPALRGLAIANKIRDFSKVAAQIAAEEENGRLEVVIRTFCRLVYTDEKVDRIVDDEP